MHARVTLWQVLSYLIAYLGLIIKISPKFTHRFWQPNSKAGPHLWKIDMRRHEVRTAIFQKKGKEEENILLIVTFLWYFKFSWINSFLNECSILWNDVNFRSILCSCSSDIKFASVARVFCLWRPTYLNSSIFPIYKFMLWLRLWEIYLCWNITPSFRVKFISARWQT